eukprot:scaffold6856_cov156-Amphora_coffeaeformis.AAC.6
MRKLGPNPFFPSQKVVMKAIYTPDDTLDHLLCSLYAFTCLVGECPLGSRNDGITAALFNNLMLVLPSTQQPASSPLGKHQARNNTKPKTV